MRWNLKNVLLGVLLEKKYKCLSRVETVMCWKGEEEIFQVPMSNIFLFLKFSNKYCLFVALDLLKTKKIYVQHLKLFTFSYVRNFNFSKLPGSVSSNSSKLNFTCRWPCVEYLSIYFGCIIELNIYKQILVILKLKRFGKFPCIIFFFSLHIFV